jgi:hypothetical protein
MVQILLTGIDDLSFDGLPGEESARGRKIDRQLPFVLRSRTAGLELQNEDAAIMPADQTIEGAPDNQLRGRTAKRERHFEQ